MKKVLLIAYHYPPAAGSSGIQRTLKFTQYLREFGWEPMVLTVNSAAHPETNLGQMSEIPGGVVIRRCIAFDAARHFSILGKYPGFLALPDRWSSWVVTGVLGGLYLIKKYHPDAIWSTYPIASAHVLGFALTRMTGLPWIADFRDSMTEKNYPSDPRQWKVFRKVESDTVNLARKCVFTSPGTLSMYRQRYPDVDQGKLSVIENAFDEENFSKVENRMQPARRKPDRTLTLVHSGILYPYERDPTAFFNAVASIVNSGRLGDIRIRIVLRATGHDNVHRELISNAGIEDIVKLEPSVPYQEAIAEMMTSDALLLFQASNCNHQTPAKLYEYMRARRPILALTDPNGDTAAVIQRYNAGYVIPLDDQGTIEKELPTFLKNVADNNIAVASDDTIQRNTRKHRTKLLAGLLDTLVH